MTGRFCHLKTQTILALIEHQGLKLWWVAEFSGIHRTTLRRWLSGKFTAIDVARARRLAATLNTRLDEIIWCHNGVAPKA